MNDINILTQRYLDGDTSLQDEKLLAEMIDRCPDATKEQKALAEMLRCHVVHDEDEMEQWLTEDETAVFDSIMAQRHQRQRRTLWKLWTAAASVVALLCMAVWLGFSNEESGKPPVATVESIPPREAEKVTPDAKNVPLPRHPVPQEKVTAASLPKQETPNKKAEEPPLTTKDNMQDAIAMIETRLNKVADSVAMAQAEQVVISDARLARLACNNKKISQQKEI